MARRKNKRFIIAFDNHGDMQDDGAVSAFFEFMDFWKPAIRIHGGDAFDLRALRKGASSEEKQEGVEADVTKGLEFMRRLDPHVFLLGNHDHRLVRYIQDGRDDMLRQYMGLLWDRIRDNMPKTKIVQWGKRRGVYRLGDYNILHGYFAGLYAARQHSQVYGNCIFGHIHAPTYFESPHINGARGYSSGSLCLLDMDYNQSHPNTMRQGHGWAYGYVTPRGNTVAYVSQKIGDEWHLPSEFMTLEAR